MIRNAASDKRYQNRLLYRVISFNYFQSLAFKTDLPLRGFINIGIRLLLTPKTESARTQAEFHSCHPESCELHDGLLRDRLHMPGKVAAFQSRIKRKEGGKSNGQADNSRSKEPD